MSADNLFICTFIIKHPYTTEAIVHSKINLLIITLRFKKCRNVKKIGDLFLKI